MWETSIIYILISGCLGLFVYLVGVIKNKENKNQTPEVKEEE